MLENREKMTIEKLTEMRLKVDKALKREKEQRKRFEEEEEYRVFI